MPKPLNIYQSRELAQLEQLYPVIDLWEIDLRKITNENGERGSLYRFCNAQNPLGRDIVWQGKTYTAYPMEASGFEMSGKGPSNRPTLTISNIFGLVTGLVSEFDDAVGAIVQRRQVYSKYLDAINFKSGNKNADPTQELPPCFYIIERLLNLNSKVATFELALPMETDNALLPARLMTILCPWQYRGENCGYSGPPVADAKDRPTTEASQDECSRCLTGCQLRFGVHSFLPYGGFPSMDKVG